MRRVTAPDGREWKVGRQWLPRRVRIRRGLDFPSDFGDVGALDDLGGVMIAIGVVVVLFVVLLVLFPVVAIALEVLLLIVLFIAGLFARVVLRKPWHVIARTGDHAYRWPVKGWRASGERVERVADALASGSMPPGAQLLKK